MATTLLIIRRGWGQDSQLLAGLEREHIRVVGAESCEEVSSVTDVESISGALIDIATLESDGLSAAYRLSEALRERDVPVAVIGVRLTDSYQALHASFFRQAVMRNVGWPRRDDIIELACRLCIGRSCVASGPSGSAAGRRLQRLPQGGLLAVSVCLAALVAIAGAVALAGGP
jgi:hypothetical protein